jgi:adenine-specific DNA-methyltransferase
MSDTVFIGGSRHVSRLPEEALQRLRTIIDKGIAVIVGDANGADTAIQKYLAEADYQSVTVFCSGDQARNNIGHWRLQTVIPHKGAKGFQFYAAKDRAMAEAADFGFMIWDGKSAGTILNILRLVRNGKKAILLDVPATRSLTFRNADDWERFASRCNDELISDLRSRAMPLEWQPQPVIPAAAESDEAFTADINAAFARNDMAAVVDLLGNFARARGMAGIAKEAGVSRESLYRSLSAGGNPEFSTVLKVMDSLGLRLSVTK